MPVQLSPLQVVRRVLAAGFACAEDDFLREGTLVVPWEGRPGRQRFSRPAGRPRLMIATMGAGAVVSCTADRLDWATRNLAQLDRDDLFSFPVLARINDLARRDGQFLAGPNLLYVGFPNAIASARCPEGITLEVFEGDQVRSLYAHEGFRHALHYRAHAERPDVLATVARDGDQVVGIAGASADTPDLWQIGIEITKEYQGRGIGKVLTARLAEEILNRGKVPYYATLASNIVSRNVARSVGLRPCWTEVGTFDGNPFPATNVG